MLHKEPHTITPQDILASQNSSTRGLNKESVSKQREIYGYNTLPKAKQPGLLVIFLSQFLSPLIYILLIAAAVSIFIGEVSDAIFISAVLLINAFIGTIQENSAKKSAASLQNLVTQTARVIRSGDVYEINSYELVPGDIVLLESGTKVPADMRLVQDQALSIDESLLTGESAPVVKNSNITLPPETLLAERKNMAFAGTLVTHGRAQGVITHTGLDTELGHIASDVILREHTKPPLLLRMEKFTLYISILVGLAVILLFFAALSQGATLNEIFLLSVALAVSAIPEGLPVALTVALAIGMRRMASHNVIVRRLMAVEALGSCTYIASDKTGTLTVNELTVRKIYIHGESEWDVTGEGAIPEGEILTATGALSENQKSVLDRICKAAVLANEATLAHRNSAWSHHGDAVDVALLVMAHKNGFVQPEISTLYPSISIIPFEPEIKYSASINLDNSRQVAFVKGALECLTPMCDKVATVNGDVPVDITKITAMGKKAAQEGFRVLAIASGETDLKNNQALSIEHLNGLTLLGMVGMIDPLRHDVKEAISICKGAGIDVAMVTGDHPDTAFTISKELGLASEANQVVTGENISSALRVSKHDVDAITQQAHVYARIEPEQKLLIVQSLQRNGHYVAVTGDGANDAPAMQASHVAVSMGKSGTDVARETSDIIITDDNFKSIVKGIEQGRVAYANIRKVIFLLISTGAAEIVLFILSLITGMPLPLLAVQLLWLNLVTNGIQDIALAFDPPEGNELDKPPRHPEEPVFNRLMIERVIISALVMGIVTYSVFYWLLKNGFSVDDARNSTLLLMVLFENVHVFNCRSETLSLFKLNPFRNRVLLFGTITAQLVHIGAMYTPGINSVLGISPVSLLHWSQLLVTAFIILIAMEIHKSIRNHINANRNA